jgi:DNA-binding SARP family transcriptional activator
MAFSMELYFFLLDYGRPVRKEQLIETLWPGDKEYIDQTLRSAIHYLRRAIGKPCVSFQAGTYTLNQSALYGDSIWYDVCLFQQHAAQAKNALKEGQDEIAKKHLQAMVQLYRGDYVQSFYSNWCIFRRDELRRGYVDARRKLAQIAWHNKQIEESIQHWQHLLAIDNCLEEAHYGLMCCYAHQGKRGLAVRQYQRCTDILQSELSIAPGPTIEKFHQQLTKNS